MTASVHQKWMRPAFAILAIAAFIFYLYQHWDSQQMAQMQIKVLETTAAVLIICLQFFIMAYLSYRLTDRQGLIPMMQYFSVHLVSNLGRLIPGRIWMIAAKMAFLKKYHLSSSWLAMTALLEVIILIIAGMIFCALPLLIWPDAFAKLGLSHHWIPVVLLIAAVAVPAVFWAEKSWNTLMRLIQKIKKQPMKAMAFPYQRTELAVITLGFMVIWALQSLSFIFIVQAVTPLSHWNPLLFMVYPIAWIAGFLALFTPAGLGVREAVIVGFLSQEIGPAQAMLVALFVRIVFTFAELGFTMLFLPTFLKLSNDCKLAVQSLESDNTAQREGI